MTEERPRTRRGLLATGALALAGLAGCVGTREETPSDAGTAADATSRTTRAPSPGATETETASPTPAPDAGAVETVVSVPGERVPENLAFGPDGDLYFGITAGEVRRLPADRTGETSLTVADTEQVASLPGAIGVEVGPDGVVYVAVATGDDRGGVWSAPPDGEASQLVRVDGFPNDLIYDADRDRLLVTESRGGAVYAVGTNGSREPWLDDDRLATESFGANGIARAGDEVFVAVTRAAGDVGRVVRTTVGEDGSAGSAETAVEGESLFGADGLTTRGGDLYVAVNSQNQAVRVRDGGVTTVADAEDGLVFPSDVLFDPSGNLFVCNFANESPADGAILRTSV